MAMAQRLSSDYPARLDIDYPERLDRLSTLLRPIYIIPLLILWYVMPGIMALPVLMLLLVRQKYPRWWFDFNLELTRFQHRTNAYLNLMTDQYPSTDEEQSVHLELDYPDARALSRWLPIVKWLLAVPHYIILAVLSGISIVLVIIAWLAIIFSGRYPRIIFTYMLNYERWNLRVPAYASLLITDVYPPFRLGA